MTTAPLISIVVATYNCASDVSTLANSLNDQVFRDFEVLIADGDSSDGTVNLAASMIENLSWIQSESDKGIYDAWNKALAHASGRWVLFLGADDYFTQPRALEDASKILSNPEHTAAWLIYGPVTVVNNRHETVGTWGKAPHKVLWQLKHGMPFDMPHSGTFHKRSLFNNIGTFNSELSVAGDYDLIIRVLLNGADKIHYSNSMNIILKGDAGISYDYSHIGIWETMLARKARGMRGVTIPWILVWLRAVVRRQFRRIT
ncbi:MAG: glycosyltransferase [Pseudomonadales bacterium]|nr:glycosyltransferase [Pseudomonadales bacterium]